MNSPLKPMYRRITAPFLGLGLTLGILIITESVIAGNFSEARNWTIMPTLAAQAQSSTPEYRSLKTSSTPASLALASHLQQVAAKMYGAYWCPHCHAQKERFGREAVAEVLSSATEPIYVECSPQGRTAPQAQVCQDAGIGAYPTWVINGEKHEGNLSLEKLAELSGYLGSQDF